MKQVLRTPQALFLFLSIIIAIPLCLKVWAIQDLYLQQETRTAVQHSMEQLRDEHGWILSGMSVDAVGATSYRLHVRQYHRGFDETDCYDVALSSSALTPCAAD